MASRASVYSPSDRCHTRRCRDSIHPFGMIPYRNKLRMTSTPFGVPFVRVAGAGETRTHAAPRARRGASCPICKANGAARRRGQLSAKGKALCKRVGAKRRPLPKKFRERCSRNFLSKPQLGMASTLLRVVWNCDEVAYGIAQSAYQDAFPAA